MFNTCFVVALSCLIFMSSEEGFFLHNWYNFEGKLHEQINFLKIKYLSKLCM